MFIDLHENYKLRTCCVHKFIQNNSCTQHVLSLQCPLINDLTSASGGECPGGSVDACIDEACVPLENVIVYAACAKGCGKRCPNK